MESLLQDGYYKMLPIQNPIHHEDSVFINDFAEQLVTDFSNCIKEPFVLKIGEFHCGRMEHTWQIEIQSTDQATSVSDVNEKNPLICTESSQYYFAKCPSRPLDNYNGKIEIAVIMAICPYKSGNSYNRYVRATARVLSRFAYMHYYESIAKHYAEWETDYINAPQYSERAVDTANHNWREYDAFDEIPKE